MTNRNERVRMTPGGRMKRALLIDPEEDEVIDEVMLGVFREPHSFTGEDMLEIYCHGSMPGVRRILQMLYRHGFRPAEPGEFTQRAFLAGKVDLTRAEAINEIVTAQTGTGHELAMQRLGGSIEHAVGEVKDQLVTVMASVAIQLDYPEEETGEIPLDPEPIRVARQRLIEMAESYRTGKLYQEGATVALAGRTNAGKSSLFNAFLREERAIVSEIHGTTRDYISSRVDFRGIPVELYDTAGLRHTEETIEEEGIRRTRNLVTATDLVVYVVDGTVGLTDEDRTILTDLGPSVRVIPVWNKGDHPDCLAPPETPAFLTVSAITMDGVDALVAHIADTLIPEHRMRSGAVVIDSLRQKNALEQAAAALDTTLEGLSRNVPVDAVSVDLQEALHALGEITGEVTSEEILDAVFSGFCVGK
jgi:tRNA modification GTPase